MAEHKFKVGDEVVYVGVWIEKIGTICKVTDVQDWNVPPRYSVNLDRHTDVAETSIRLLSKLEKALK